MIKLVFIAGMIMCAIAVVVGILMMLDALVRPEKSPKKANHLLAWLTYFELNKQTDLMRMKAVRRNLW